MNQIILNADDFGASKAINDGIKKAIAANIVKSVSVMVTMPYFADAIRYLKKNPQVKIGLHFNLTENSKHNYFTSILLSFITNRFRDKLIYTELLRQYLILKKTGLKISHLDSHQHIHLIPSVYKVFVEFATSHHISRIRGATQFNVKKIASFKQFFIQVMFVMQYYFFPSGKTFDNIFDLNWQNDYNVKNILSQISSSSNGSLEVICHVSAVDTGDSQSMNRKKCLSFLLKHWKFVLKDIHDSRSIKK